MLKRFRRKLRRRLLRVVDRAVRFYLVQTGRKVLRVSRKDRIGHLVGEIDCVMREEHLRDGKPIRPILLAGRDQIANAAVARAWREHVDLVEAPWLDAAFERVCEDDPKFRMREDMLPYFTAIDDAATAYSIYREWGDRPPLVGLTRDERARGEAALRELGVPEGAPFVCFHCRDAGYSPEDEGWHSYRNSAIETYLPAMKALHERGIYGIRMGDPTMPRLQETEGVLDYVHSPLRSAWMDVFLCAQTEFFLGNSSGLYLVALAFGRPSALANLAPTSTALGTGPADIAIPKLLFDEKADRLLRFDEIFDSPVANFRFADEFKARGIRALESEPEDVTALALEMFDRLRGQAVYLPADESRQQRYQGLFSEGHYAFGSGGRGGRDFLRRYEDLLGPGPQADRSQP